MPATESTWRNQALLHRIFAVTGVLLTLATVWMFYKDHYRSWKKFQPKSLEIEQKMTQWREEQVRATEAYRAHSTFEEKLRQAETAPIDQRLILKDAPGQEKLPDQLRPSFIESLEQEAARRETSVSTDRIERNMEKLAALHAEASEARKAAEDAAKAAEKASADEDLKAAAKAAFALSQKKDDAVRALRKTTIADLKSRSDAVKRREDKLLNDRKVRNGKIDAAKANVDIAIRDQKTQPEIEQLQKEVDRLMNEPGTGYVALNTDYQSTSSHRKHLERLIKEITEEEAAAKKASADAQADLVRLQTSFVEKRETYVTWYGVIPLPGKKILNLPIVDAFGTTRKIDNLWSKDLEIGYGSFSNVRRFDRCTTCHQGMQKSLPGQATSPAYVGEHRFELVLTPPSKEDLAKLPAGAQNSNAEELLGVRFAESGLIADGDITVKFVRPQSPAARAVVTRGGEVADVEGAKIREATAEYAAEPSQEEANFPTRPGLMVGDVIERVNDDEVFGGLRTPERIAAMLADLVPEGKPIRLYVRRGLPSPYTSHPRLDLFVSDSSPHRMATFGCTICHEGQGSATEFKWASHTPNDQVQAESWTKDPNLGWFDNPHWIFPMYAKRFTESTCLKCHHEVVELETSEEFPAAPAPKVVHGYQLIRKYGCFGCHEVNGFDGPAKRVGPDLRLEPNYFAVAQELTRQLPALEKKYDDQLQQELAKKLEGRTVAEIQKEYATALGEQLRNEKDKTDLATSTDPDKDAKIAKATADAEKAKEQADALAKTLEPVKKNLSAINTHRDRLEQVRSLTTQLAAHPEDNAARAELRGLLDEDAAGKESTLTAIEHRQSGMLKDVEVPGSLRKVGPSLRFIGQKLDQPFLYDWLNDPKNFRPTTRMPRFFNLHDHLQDPKDEKSLDTAKRLEPIEIRGVMAYLLDYKQSFEPIQPPDGIDGGTADEKLARGKFQFETRGCLACHTHDDFPDVNKFRKAEDIVQGPDLSNIHLKFAQDRNPQGRSWLYSWIKEPTRYHARTVMPNLFLNPESDPADPKKMVDPAADIVEYLLSAPAPLEGEQKGVHKESWQPVAEGAKKLADIKGGVDDLNELVEEYLKDAFPEFRAKEIVQKGLSPDYEAELKGAEKELIVRGSVDLIQQKLRYIGKKTIAKYGCYGCHDIPGFEDAKPIGTGLADWGRKDSSKLAFEHIAEYLEHHGHAEHGEVSHGKKEADSHGSNSAVSGKPSAEEQETSAFFHHQLEAGNRIGFIYQKLQEPRSYDFKKTGNKRYNERLRMPQFPFSAEDREAVITFVLGLVAEPPRDKYLYKPSARDGALIAGKKVLEKYNCGGCHLLETEKWKISYPAGAFGVQGTNATFPYLLPHVAPAELSTQGTPDHRNELHSLLQGMPATAAADGRPILLDESDDSQLDDGSPYNPRAVKYAVDLYRPTILDGGSYITGQSSIMVADRMVDERFPATGGVLARYLVPRVTQFEKKSNPNASGSEAWAWVPPPLTHEGSKVQPNWLHDFLLDPYPIRPAVFLRMPKFNMTSAEATALVNYFAAHDSAKFPYEMAQSRQESRLALAEAEYRKLVPPDEIKDKNRSVRFDDAMKIVTNNNYCVKCHMVADFVPQGSPRALAPNLANVYRRLRPDFMRDWIANPKMILPYTAMPVNIRYEESAPYHLGISQELYRGNAEDQVDGLVDLLSNFDQYARTNTNISKLVPAPPPAAIPAGAEPQPEEKKD